MIERSQSFYQVVFQCPCCNEAVAPSQAKRGCEACMAWHHEDCYFGNNGRGQCGTCHIKARPDVSPVQHQSEFRLCIATPCREPAVEKPANRHLAGYCGYHAGLEGRRQGLILKISGGILTGAGLCFVPGVSSGLLKALPVIGLGLCLIIGVLLILKGRRTLNFVKRAWPKAKVKATVKAKAKEEPREILEASS